MRVFFSRRRGSEEIDGLGEPILLREILDKVQLAFFVRGRDQKKKEKRRRRKMKKEKFTNERHIVQRRDDNFSTFDV